MDKVMSNKKIIALYVLPALLVIMAVVYIPIILTAYYGLNEWNGIGAMTFIGLDNYQALLTDGKFWDSAWHSLLLAVFSAASLIIYLAVAMVLASKIKGANLFRKIYLIPMLLSSVAIAQLWLRIYHPTNGIVNSFLESIGISNPPAWLAEPSLVLFALFIPILWQYAGFYILIYYAALKNIPASLVEAAKIDGATSMQIAFRIKLPLIMEVIKVTIVLAVVGSLKYFDLIFVMTDGGPNGSSEVMASYMYHTAFRAYDFGYGSAIGFFLLVICLIVTWVIRKLTASKETIQYS
ncbi:binding-protein-dependent transport systems inner membrane component [Paenibacillus vortex V453]|uniref:ABC transporter permease n=3 Tax=Paenibacillus TaxID=44249 RepID=A0A163KPQ1_9BACL|nr:MULTISPECIES: sugar ABC transporter permease [Paenibacillus]ANA81361.1 ABC transporter permease [Paenibacillus glucanolyticus]AVV59909.1 sugar ABC transporter permease [Paenibacillus glucanolyticus]AWP29165.1 ABC transporter permease [Paenibacillus sp. Cedars]EFU42477.1 binding-protein-dependent transport systems inner membrane component [Paenibacillus vortex V453]ETT35597.1 binding-protein-dependent transport systems inner membrane component [Paenibacillus sp. FSL R5-808]